MADQIKIGAYICQGCGLGERLDTDQLANVAQKEGRVDLVKQHPCLCEADGVATIRNDVDSEGITHLVLAACSRRAKTEAFNFEDVAISRANLREGVIWTQPDTEEARELTQEMADDYIRMGCAEIKHMKQPAPYADRGSNKRILVVGGGFSGMTAALEAADAGYEVLLVEKSGKLGGWAGRIYKRLPSREPFANPEDPGVDEMVNQVQTHPDITVFLNTTITRTSGAPGQFSVNVSTESGGTETENVGAIVQASGFHLFDATKLTSYGYGQTPDVVDQAGLEQLAMESNGGPINRPSDGKPVKSVVFVQCAGQRSDKEGELAYCSGYCCSVSVKQAIYFKDRDPEIDTNVIYTDLRMPGDGEDFYRAAQRRGVTFTKGVVAEVRPNGGDLSVNFFDKILNDDVDLKADLVVLATGQIPNSGVDIEAVAAPPEEKEAAPEESATEEMVAEELPVIEAADSILNLTYRQGPDLPHLKYGFSDSHFICFPYETRRTGIYACGPVRRPMDMVQAREDATGAALKAIQAVENASQGRAAHPRSGDLSFPSFRREGCTQCKRCTVECPFGAIDEDEQRFPQFNEPRCRRCGTCMGACPVRVISFENYSIDTVGQQIKAIDMPDEFEEKPRILVLACENDAYPALDMAGMNRVEYNAFVRVVPVRCLGSVNLIWVTDALNSGFDGVMLMGCKKGADYQCHFVRGSELAHDRLSKVDDTLSQLQLEPERVQVYEVEITDVERAPLLINEYAARIQEIGMNPFKSF